MASGAAVLINNEDLNNANEDFDLNNLGQNTGNIDLI